ncbi:MAG: glycosyltransferase family 4 protein [Chloroflexi bacterium]|nr:glycosyltransferase family 4 protein [Chloroflexota bacterium]
MNILHLCRQYHPSVGGVERFVSDLATRLAARGHTVEVATLNRLWRRPGALAGEEVVGGIPVHRVPFIGGPLFFFAPGILPLLSRFDVLHVHNTDFFLDFVAATRSIHRRPFVVSTHGGFFHTPDHSALKRLYFTLVTRRSLWAASAVIPNSASDERRFAPRARWAVRIDNAIDCASFSMERRQPVPGRLITVGRLAPNKNVSGLLKVFARAREARPDLSLVVVGEGPLRGQLQRQAEESGIGGAVEWKGELGDEALKGELAAAEVFLSAATYEGFGLAMLEATAAGAVPVVNDIEAFRDVIDDGRNGFIADYANAPTAAKALLEVISLPPERKAQLSASAKAKASEFDWEKAAPKFEEVYLSVVSNQ